MRREKLTLSKMFKAMKEKYGVPRNTMSTNLDIN